MGGIVLTVLHILMGGIALTGPTCTVLHELSYMYCPTCTALHVLPYMYCPTCTVLHAQSYM